jgi:hypothetical protein
MKLRWTLLLLASLGGPAAADTVTVDGGSMAELASTPASYRGVSQNYLVMPSGGEVTAQMRFMMADPIDGAGALRFTDLALFGVTARYSLLSRLEVAGTVDLLPKQPSSADEKVWQSAGGSLRTPLGKRSAVALSGGGGHLLGHSGMWTRESLTLQWRKPIADEIMLFDVEGGVDAIGLRAPNTSSSALIAEVAVKTSVVFRDPHGDVGAWVGIGYALPIQSSGKDPTTELAVDPQPRLDFHLGGVISLVKTWDVFADLAIIDRGDAANPATRLPILDGGFDQKQVILGVSRHFEGPKRRPTYDSDPMQLSAR